MRMLKWGFWTLVVLSTAVALTACGKARDSAVAPAPGKPVEAIKLEVAESGLYRVTRDELEQLGFKYKNYSELGLSLRGVAVPLWSEDDSGAEDLFFYGTASESVYSRTNFYLLSNAGVSAANIARENPADIEDVSRTYQAQVMLEENQVYSPLVETGDHWFWERLPAPQQQTVEVELDEVDEGPGKVQIVVWGSTQSPGEQDHHLRVSVNGMLVVDEFWDGLGWRTLEGEVKEGVFQQGKNTIVLEAPGDSGAAADVIWLDEIEIGFTRQATANGDYLEFVGDGSKLAISGFSSPIEVFDVTDGAVPVRLEGIVQEGEEVLVPGQKDHRYIAVGKGGYLTPNYALPAQTIDLRGELAGANYVAIGPKDLLAGLPELLAKRDNEGIETLAVPLDEIYDQFNWGSPEPEAVRDFLIFAANNWEIKPQYILLVGDATYDPIGYQTPPESNRLPTFFTFTVFGGQTASDLPFVDVDGDGKPDLAVGRIPAQTPDQALIWVKKTLDYEAASSSAWQKKALAIADGQEISFQADAQEFLDQVASGYQGDLFAPPAGSKEAARAIQDYFEDGYGLIGYFGHGSLSMWGRDRLFTVEDIPRLQNHNLPIVLTITCLNGYFIHPTTTSFAEELLWQPGGGAAAVLAPTSLTLAADQAVLGKELYLRLASGEGRLGDMVLAAQRSVPGETRGQIEVRDTFLLFGDPALKIAGK